MPQHVRKGDQVMILSGDDRGSTGKILRVIPKRCKVVVEGINVCKRHVKRSQKNPQGGIIQKEMPIAISNVAPYVEGRATRVRFQTKGGAKVRVAVRTGQPFGPELRKADR